MKKIKKLTPLQKAKAELEVKAKCVIDLNRVVNDLAEQVTTLQMTHSRNEASKRKAIEEKISALATVKQYERELDGCLAEISEWRERALTVENLSCSQLVVLAVKKFLKSIGVLKNE